MREITTNKCCPCLGASKHCFNGHSEHNYSSFQFHTLQPLSVNHYYLDYVEISHLIILSEYRAVNNGMVCQLPVYTAANKQDSGKGGEFNNYLKLTHFNNFYTIHLNDGITQSWKSLQTAATSQLGLTDNRGDPSCCP